MLVERQLPSQRWYRPLRALTIVVGTLALVTLCGLSIVAWEVRRPNQIAGAFGAFCGLEPEFQHGWPLRYAYRDATRLSDERVGGDTAKALSPWQCLQGLREFRVGALIVDVLVGAVLVLTAAVTAQWWTSHRRRWGQWLLVDVFGLTALVSVACVWAASWHRESQLEVKLIAALQQGMPKALSHGTFVQKDVAVPSVLPERVARQYRRCFERVVSVQTEGDTDVASQFPGLALLKSWELPSNFGEHVTRMPQLEVLELDGATLYRRNPVSDFTVVRDLPALPNLRIVSFRNTSVQDADLEWLAKCSCLEVICLSLTQVGDDGVRHLSQLKKLRVLVITSNNLTDDGCRLLSRIESLQDLTIGSSNVRNDGILELAHLEKLSRLCLRTAASNEAVANLRERLPGCSIDAESITAATSSGAH
jgi:hypothetical protein